MLFSFVSFRALSPVFWFGLVLFGFALLQANWRRRFAVASLIVPAVLLLHEKATVDHFAVWTPYQQIDIQRYYFKHREWRDTLVNVKHVGYQMIIDILPELSNRHPCLLSPPR